MATRLKPTRSVRTTSALTLRVRHLDLISFPLAYIEKLKVHSYHAGSALDVTVCKIQKRASWSPALSEHVALYRNYLCLRAYSFESKSKSTANLPCKEVTNAFVNPMRQLISAPVCDRERGADTARTYYRTIRRYPK